MRRRNSRPAWWQLYVLGLVMVGLLALVALAHLSVAGHEVAAIGALLLVFCVLGLWLRANARALMRADEEVMGRASRPRMVLPVPRDDDGPVYASRLKTEPRPLLMSEAKPSGCVRQTAASTVQERKEQAC